MVWSRLSSSPMLMYQVIYPQPYNGQRVTITSWPRFRPIAVARTHPRRSDGAVSPDRRLDTAVDAQVVRGPGLDAVVLGCLRRDDARVPRELTQHGPPKAGRGLARRAATETRRDARDGGCDSLHDGGPGVIRLQDLDIRVPRLDALLEELAAAEAADEEDALVRTRELVGDLGTRGWSVVRLTVTPFP